MLNAIFFLTVCAAWWYNKQSECPNETLEGKSVDAGHESKPIATSNRTSIDILDNAGDRNSTFNLIPLGSSTIASLKSLGSGNLGTLPPEESRLNIKYWN